MGSFTRWLTELFGAAKAQELEDNGYKIPGTSSETVPLDLEKAAIQSAVGLISAAVGQCRFRTFLTGEEIKGEEYYLWNYSPNSNQNSTQFLQDWVETLIYNDEALIVERRGQLYIADSFLRREEGTGEDIFEQISVKGESLPDKKAGEVLYFRQQNSDVRPLLSNLCHQYERLIEKAVTSYERASAEKGILNVDSTKRGPINSEEYEKDLMDNKFKRFYSSQNAVLPLHAGYTYTPHTRAVRNASEINDVKSMSDEAYNKVGQALRVPPALLRGETAQSGDVLDRFLRFAVRPICNMLEEEITRKRYGREAVINGSFLTVDTSMVEISGILASADKLDKVIGCGILSIDEVREKVGECAIGTEDTQKHFVTKNYGEIDTGRQKAGEGESDE